VDEAIQVNESGFTLDSRVLYLVLFDTFVFKILNKNKSHFWADLLLWKKKPRGRYQILPKKSKLRHQKEVEKFTSE
jgi:hypothetical protein